MMRGGWWILIVGIVADVAAGGARAAGSDGPWWHRYPTFAGVVGGEFPSERAAGIGARMVTGNYAADPGWGPYGQRLSILQEEREFRAAKDAGLRWVTWVEGYGEAIAYAIVLARESGGSFASVDRDRELAYPARNAFAWEREGAGAVSAGEVRWVGAHNSIEEEDFVRGPFGRERVGLPLPTHPDGSPATGCRDGVAPPLCYRMYEAVAARSIDGRLAVRPVVVPRGANEIDGATGRPRRASDGLLALRLDANLALEVPGKRPGDILHVAALGFDKDPAAPFWLGYARAMVREIARRGADGVWVDNFSPHGNLGVPPLRNAFGEWTEHRFREFLARDCGPALLREMGVGDPATFDVRAALIARAREYGAADASVWSDPAWRDPRWLDDRLWGAFKSFKQRVGQEALRALYAAAKEEGRAAGREDGFLVAGSDIPCFGLGWARDGWLDMVSTELTNGWGLATGTRGVGLPPGARHAPIYLAAREHQSGPHMTVRYSLFDPGSRLRDSEELARVLLGEAFACGAFFKYGGVGRHPGTDLCVTEWNLFLQRSEPVLGGRRPLAEVGLVFSPDNQLAGVVPGGVAIHLDRQAHLLGHWGFGTALVEGHVPYRAVADWKLGPDALRGLRVLVMPQVETLDPAAAVTIEDWVRGGGRLVASGPAGMREGPGGLFARRSRSSLAALLDGEEGWGRVGAAGGEIRACGRGVVVRVRGDLDVRFYLREGERPALRSELLGWVGAGETLRIEGLPPGIGAFPFEARDGGALFVDLVNYDYDPEADRVCPALNLRFRLPPRRGWEAREVDVLSPDGLTKAWLEGGAGGSGAIEISVPKLRHYASVRIGLAS